MGGCVYKKRSPRGRLGSILFVYALELISSNRFLTEDIQNEFIGVNGINNYLPKTPIML
jgi:hypothetical protein